MIPPPIVVTDLGDLTRYLVERLDRLETIAMATKAQIEQMFADQSAAVTDYVDDVNARMAELNAKLEAALANDSADAAALAEMKALTDDVVIKGTAITEALKAADASVDRPA